MQTMGTYCHLLSWHHRAAASKNENWRFEIRTFIFSTFLRRICVIIVAAVLRKKPGFFCVAKMDYINLVHIFDVSQGNEHNGILRVIFHGHFCIRTTMCFKLCESVPCWPMKVGISFSISLKWACNSFQNQESCVTTHAKGHAISKHVEIQWKMNKKTS